MALFPNRGEVPARTVGRAWGQGPVRIEPVTGTVDLPPGRWTCHALRPDGTRGPEVRLGAGADGAPTLSIAPEYTTLWYLVER